MKTLYESILDADFDGNLAGLEATYAFENGLQRFKPKNENEAYTYWLAIRKAFYYILTNINKPGDTTYSNKLKLQMLEKLATLPGKVEVPCLDEDTDDWSTFSTEDKFFLEIITKHYLDIEQNNFRPWASPSSSGSLMYALFDDDAGYTADPDYLPEDHLLFKGFDKKRYEDIKKKVYNLAVRCVDMIKHMK